MPYPDIKDTGALVEFIRWGSPHHGLLDGAMLEDGTSHPRLEGYWQSNYAYIVPCFGLSVPGHTPPALPAPSPGNNWLGYGLFTGTRLAFYRKTLLPIPQYAYWVVSFGVGDTWRCSITSGIPTVSAGGGSCTVTLVLTRFGEMQMPDDQTLTINLTSNTLSPIGQPSFTGGADDFQTGTYTALRPLDISADGTRVLLGVMPDIEGYFGYSAPRGILLLEITRSSATLSLFKSRADMLVGVTRSTTGQNIYYTTARTLGAYFDASGTAHPLTEVVTSSRVLTQDTTTNNGTTYTRISTMTGTQNVLIEDDTRTVAEATWVNAITLDTTGTKVDDLNWELFTDQIIDYDHTQLTGRQWIDGVINGFGPQTASQPDHINVGIEPSFGYSLPIGVQNLNDGTYTRPPIEFRNFNGNLTISQIGGGVLIYVAPVNIEYSFVHARTLTANHAAYTTGNDWVVACTHPIDGITASKRGSWTVGSEPSFGWV